MHVLERNFFKVWEPCYEFVSIGHLISLYNLCNSLYACWVGLQKRANVHSYDIAVDFYFEELL